MAMDDNITDFVKIEVPTKVTTAITAVCFWTWLFWAERAVDLVNATDRYKLWVHQPCPYHNTAVITASAPCGQSRG
jgi:glutathionyl-hydroquinone reductase